MQLVVFEDWGYINLLPLVYSRATFNLRCGCDNLLAKIESAAGRQADSLFVRPALVRVIDERQRTQHPRPRPVNVIPDEDDQLWINGRLLARRLPEIPAGSAAWRGDMLLAARIDGARARAVASALSRVGEAEIAVGTSALRGALSGLAAGSISEDAASAIDYPWNLVHHNAAELARQLAAMPRASTGRVQPGAHVVNEAAVHVAGGATIKPGSVLDAEAGPIWIGEGATVGPSATVVGPCYIGERSVIRPGALVSGSSIGMVCKVGGDVEGTVFHGYSNKQHDGFLGHSYVGEWVNLGAGTVNSDLKNTYGTVRVPINGRTVDSGAMFVGSFIGDHVKTGIGTALPTGCVAGYGSNVLASGLAPKFIPSFTWLAGGEAAGGRGVRAAYDLEKMIAVARRVVARRERQLTACEEALIRSIHGEAARREAGGAA